MAEKCAKIMDMKKLGARGTGKVLDFGLYLPGISYDDGYELYVKIIHEHDQFLQDIPAFSFSMSHSPDPEYGDYWHSQIDLENSIPTGTKTAGKSSAKSAWGEDGKYVYRYCLKRPGSKDQIDWIIDPFAREFGIGKLSSFTVGYKDYEWEKDGLNREFEKSWMTPHLEDLIIYELMINEFAESLDGAIARLDYLTDLGINCIEVMPVSNVAETVDWGFHPIGYFGIDERFGKTPDMQRFIDRAHQKGIAVILDVVYGHTDDLFAYAYLYDRLKDIENPFIGAFSENYFGRSTNFNKQFTRDFFLTVNHRLLETYHVDGFRYDCVPEFWDGPTGIGYACLSYETYKMVQERKNATGYWQRFFDDDGRINLIQCAEQLEKPKEILQGTYSNCTWQNGTLDAAVGVVKNNAPSERIASLTNLGLLTGLFGYTDMVLVEGGEMKKLALQYIENHDHARFICNFGTTPAGIEDLVLQLKGINNELCSKLVDNTKFAEHIVVYRDGDLQKWYKIQPHMIAIFTAKGIPMLWQGQEFGENYHLQKEGWGRVKMLRPMRWDYFYSDQGNSIVHLVRKLIRLRRGQRQLRIGEHWFYNNPDLYQSKGILLFSRRYLDDFSLIALNFSDQDQTVPFVFPLDGDYDEELHGEKDSSLNLKNVVGGMNTMISIPSNYGRIWSI